MNQVLTILRREIKSYFTGPIGYIYLVTFLLFTNFMALFLIRGKSFFELPVADMREYFHVLAGVSTFLVAAVTMRLWSEERKENTYEMLLTFPMKAHQLVLGKFFASLLFYAVALAGTLTVPLMMILLSQSGDDSLAQTGFWGELDPGATLSGYFGALLLGGAFIAFGLFISSLCGDQIVAFVLTAPSLFIAYILGWQRVKSLLDELLSGGVGSFIGDSIGIFRHFDYLARGLVTGSGILFFLAWIAIFLVLNGLAIERRSRPNSNILFAASVVLLVMIGGVGNRLLLKNEIFRADVTEESIFTIDPISVEVMKNLDDVITIRYVVSPRSEMPAELQDLERDVRDKVDALKRAAPGKINFQVIYQPRGTGLEEEDDESKEESDLEKRLFKDIQPFSAEVRESGKVSAQLIYSGIKISFGEKENEVLSPLTKENLPGLEYTLVKFVYKITRDDVPVVALHAPVDRINPQMAAIYQQMGRPVPPPDDPFMYLGALLEQENFQVNRFDFTKESPLPAEYDVLALVVTKTLNERQLWEINRALVNGKPVFLAVQEHVFKYQGSGGRYSAEHVENDTGINGVLGASGVTVGDAIVMSESSTNFIQGVPTPFGMLPQPFPSEFRMHLELSGDTLNSDHPILKGVPRFRYLWGTPLRFDKDQLKKDGITVTTLLRSEKESWTRVVSGEQLTSEDIQPPKSADAYGSKPLAVILDGQLADAFKGTQPPEWPEPPMMQGQPPQPTPPTDTTITPAPGKLLLIANAWAFHRDVLLTDQHPEGIWFFVNAISNLNPDPMMERINNLKYKTFRMRLMPPISDRWQGIWKFIQFGGPVVVLSAAGIAMWVLRKRRREMYLAELRGEGQSA